MLREERFQEILHVLEMNGPMTPKSMSKALYTSLSTVYRDIGEMEKRHLVVLQMGLVSKNDLLHMPMSYDMRHHINLEEKKLLAKKAATFIQPGTQIFMDASSTVEQMAYFIPPDKDITVVTNSFTTAEILRNRAIHTFFLGGAVVEHSGAVTTTIGADAIDRYDIDRFFFSAYGLSNQGIISTSFELEARILKLLFNRKIPSVFLCGENKFGKNSFFKIVDLYEVDTFICSVMPPVCLPHPRKTVVIGQDAGAH